MIELDESVVVDRPREAVFAHIARIEAVPDWLPVVQEATLLDPGDVRVGSLVRLAIAGPGARVTATGEITELVAPERIAMRTLDAPVNSPLGASSRRWTNAGRDSISPADRLARVAPVRRGHGP